MDFAQPVAFKNADIGRCTYQKPREDEEVPTEVIGQPQPLPTPAFPSPVPTLTHVSFHIDTAFETSFLNHFQNSNCLRYLVDSVTGTRGPATCL